MKVTTQIPDSYARFMQPVLPSGSAAPADVPADVADPRQLACDITQLAGEERDLAIDMLVNLAAGTSPQGKYAQATLRQLYANPNEFAGANLLNDHGKQDLRSCLKAAAHSMCELVFNANALPRGGSDQPLSATVAYLGGRCGPPAGAPVTQDRAQVYLERQISHGGSSLDSGDKLLAPGRYANERELTGAARSLSTLPLYPKPLNMNITGRTDDVVNAMFTQPLRDLVTEVRAGAGPACKAAWIHTGDTSYPHWMPLVVRKDNAGGMHYHVVDTHASAPSGNRIHQELLVRLAAAGVEESQVTFHSAEMQTNAPNACGPLGHDVLKALDRELRESGHKAEGAEVAACIDRHMQHWCNLPPADQEAGALCARAELLECWQADGTGPVLDRPIVAQPLPEPAPAGLPVVMAFATQIRLSRGDDRLEKETSKISPTYTSALDDLAGYANALAGVTDKTAKPADRLLAGVQMGDRLRKLPDAMRPLALALETVKRTTAELEHSPLLTGDPKVLKLDRLRNGLGVTALSAQLPTRITMTLAAALALADKVQGGNGKNPGHIDQLGKALEEVNYAARQVPVLEDAMRELIDIAKLTPALRSDAQKLRAALMALRGALIDPRGIAQQLDGFVKAATGDPFQAATSLCAVLGPRKVQALSG